MLEDHWNHHFAVESLTGDRLGQLLSGAESMPRSTAAPSLSYGRHRGPAPGGSRIAAVIVALYQDARQQWMIPLTLRPRSLQHHGGQVCLPGGRVELHEDVHEAAVREFEEELGVKPTVIHHCGQLSTQYVYASDNLVHPIVAVIRQPDRAWRPDPIEVEQVIELPLSVLLDAACRQELVRDCSVRSGRQVVDSLSFRATAFVHEGHRIWGATALILDQLAQILQQCKGIS